MLKLSSKVILVVVMVGLSCLIGLKGYTQSVDEGEIAVAFQDAMNAVLYPQELALYKLSSQEVKDSVLPSVFKIIINTIELIHERTGQDIGLVDVVGALPPELEKSLEANMEQLSSQVKDALGDDTL